MLSHLCAHCCPVLSLQFSHFLSVTDVAQCLQEEKTFEEQYVTWKKQFDDWKEQNKGIEHHNV